MFSEEKSICAQKKLMLTISENSVGTQVNEAKQRPDPVDELHLEGVLFNNLEKILEDSKFFEEFAQKIQEGDLLERLKQVSKLPSTSKAVKRNISDNADKPQFYQNLLDEKVFQNFLIDQFVIFNNLKDAATGEEITQAIETFLEHAIFNFIDTLKAYYAYKDPLTNLWNREGFEKIVQNIIDHCREAEKIADQNKDLLLVFFIDINNFKTVNDLFGHDYGDEFLEAFGIAANQLSSRKNDVFARVGGDEFMFVMTIKQPKSQDEGEKTSSAIANKLEELKENFIKKLGSGARAFNLSYSVGVSVIADFPETASVEDLLNEAKIQADASLGREKEKKDKVVFPQPTPEDIGRIIKEN